jgi:4-hydroxy-3-polyprenylbenzoate decarboxylase
MRYRSLNACVADLRANKHLIDIASEVDPHLEVAEIHRRVFAKKGPALLFKNLKGCRFPAVSNLFGTPDRYHFIFRSQFEAVKRAIELKADPNQALLRPWRYWNAPLTGLFSLPKKVRSGPVLLRETTIDQLPKIVCWPKDGGPFVTLPQVYSESPIRPGIWSANIGMYRVQLAGNNYETNREVGIHYQIHRGLGIHHAEALQSAKTLRVSLFVGGPPAHSVAAVMPLPEGLPETIFAGMLAGRRMRLAERDGFRISVDADFVIVGTIDLEKTKPEGPFGDHLGYYSLIHDFPYMRVEKVYHRPDAIWPFTVVGRPPQEDSSFGELIHELTTPMVPVELPGVKALHAVDVAGVHPLLLAIGSERYVPYAKERKPQEILTHANAILGFNQCSLAKFLIIAAAEDRPELDIHNLKEFFGHILERVDWNRDLHFQTKTTIDTLDYSGDGLNEGSKVVIAVAGPVRRKLSESLPRPLSMPLEFSEAKVVMPGLIAVQGPSFADLPRLDEVVEDFGISVGEFPLVVVVDNLSEAASCLEDLIWVCFTRANPAPDIYGIGSKTLHKHWGCSGSLVVDARIKPHHAPPLTISEELRKRVDQIMHDDETLRPFLE